MTGLNHEKDGVTWLASLAKVCPSFYALDSNS